MIIKFKKYLILSLLNTKKFNNKYIKYKLYNNINYIFYYNFIKSNNNIYNINFFISNLQKILIRKKYKFIVNL